MEYSCGMIQDLLPFYLEGNCSLEAEAAVEEHLLHCEDCNQHFFEMQEENLMFQQEISRLEKWGVLWMLKEFFDCLWQNYRTILKGAAILTAACLILAAGYCAWWGLTQVDCVPVSSKDFQVEKVMQLLDGDIFCSYYVRYHSTFTHHYVISENTVYFTAMRPVLDETYSMLGEHGGCWIMDPDSVWNEGMQSYVSIEAIYLGNPDDAILIWQRGIDLPIASYEEQAWVDSADWTIF